MLHAMGTHDECSKHYFYHIIDILVISAAIRLKKKGIDVFVDLIQNVDQNDE